MQARPFIATAAILMFTGVAAGAFGAHGLKQMLSADMLAIWQTAVTYQMVHGLGMLALGIMLQQQDNALLRKAAWAMLAGVIIFSGSLYALALTGVRILGAITPIGGVAFLVGWAMLAWAVIRR
ncbi:DUF423 domain-containing protein [Undibacterium pigrum]|uniref:Uncharacterized membrane protein YgdD (TMEM256/DUF423 family) n=1 Tax=Undibacterium pigrum TaxID=401470 RepID=A0A318J2N9_9BURK|nr:DUF423 domain-containing protein [Undibacterium pigrum]PXX41896.1 uncharacterized membrane protein YgdD (TMEM256/DUF423 family) [Undibacterium pigrum]